MSINCAELSADYLEKEIGMNLLEQEYMVNGWEQIVTQGEGAMLAVHIHEEDMDRFTESGMMKTMKEEGDLLFTFENFGERPYSEIKVIRFYKRVYEKLVISNNKESDVLLSVNKDKSKIVILDCNSDEVKRHGVDYFIRDNTFSVLPVKGVQEIAIEHPLIHLDMGEDKKGISHE